MPRGIYHRDTYQKWVGKRFGHLEVLKIDPVNINKAVVKCDCGNEYSIYRGELTRTDRPTTKCFNCAPPPIKIKHGMYQTPEYRIWAGMVSRCTNLSNTASKNYLLKGIKVANCFDGPGGFENFIEEVGLRPSSKHSIERIDNTKGYIKGNMKWATIFEQSRNKKSNVLLTYKGETKCLSDWADQLKINRVTLRNRLRKGYKIEEAFFPTQSAESPLLHHVLS